MVSIRKAKQTGFKLRRKGRRGPVDAETVGLVVAGLCIGFLMMFLYSVAFSESSAGEPGGIPESLRKTKKHPVLMETTEDGDTENGNESNANIVDPNHPPIKHVRPMADVMNAFALDIVETLDCVTLLKEAEDSLKSYGGRGANTFTDDYDSAINRRRRLQQHADDGGFADNPHGDIPQEQKNENEGDDDSIPEERWGDLAGNDRDIKSVNDDGSNFERSGDDEFGSDYGNYPTWSAKHLFCIAASENPPEAVSNEIRCDGSKRKRKTLLELWSDARSQMHKDLLLKVLDLARESEQTMLGKSYNIWAPSNDEGVEYMVNSLREDQNVDRGGLNGLEDALGPGKVFVDVGSCLGLTCLVINSKYPGTKIVSLEPASPNWLLQELNLRCNISHKEFKKMSVILVGVGANTEEEDNTMSKLMWRPTSTTSTRSWSPSSEFKDGDEELIVKLRKLRSILAEAGVIHPAHINVLNVDCQGCEYNMIHGLTKEEFEEIPTVMGTVHWGYIQPTKLPSSERGRKTHERLCGHENIARRTKECCAFPDMPVKSSVPGEVLQKNESKGFPPRESTVSDVIADNLCDDFSTWAKEHYLNEVFDDFNWFELSSQA
jgi:FkbM family methyltransferase